MCPENMNLNSPPKCARHVQETLTTALVLTETGVDLRKCYTSSMKSVSQLRNIFDKTENAIKTLQNTSKCALEQAHKMVSSINSDTSTKECDELIEIIEKQLNELHLSVGTQDFTDPENQQKGDRVRTPTKSSENLAWFSKNKILKCDSNEKYPGSVSRESLIDLNAVVNLPPVPEDIFTSFTKPTRSSSLSSLKSMRKIKMFLQKAESSDDDDSSELEEHDYPKISLSKIPIGDVKGTRDDSDDSKLPSPLSKKLLGNIKEETKNDE